MPASRCFRQVRDCVELCRSLESADSMGLCVADCEVDLFSCLREQTGIANTESLTSIALTGLLLPAMTTPLQLPVVSGSEVSRAPELKRTPRDAVDLQQWVSPFRRLWKFMLRGGGINDTVQTAALLVPLFSGMVAFVWDLAARRFYNRGEIPPQPPCPGCGAGDQVLIGGQIDLITVAFVALPALFAATLLFRPDIRAAMLRNSIGVTLLVLAAGLSIVGLLRGISTGFTESYRWLQ